MYHADSRMLVHERAIELRKGLVIRNVKKYADQKIRFKQSSVIGFL